MAAEILRAVLFACPTTHVAKLAVSRAKLVASGYGDAEKFRDAKMRMCAFLIKKGRETPVQKKHLERKSGSEIER